MRLSHVSVICAFPVVKVCISLQVNHICAKHVYLFRATAEDSNLSCLAFPQKCAAEAASFSKGQFSNRFSARAMWETAGRPR